MKVAILNQFNSDNIGDKLIGLSMKQYFEARDIDVELGGYAQTKNQDIVISATRAKGIFSSLKRRCPAIIKYYLKFKKEIRKEANRIQMNNIDAIVIGGGQLIKHNGVFSYCFSDWVRRAVRYNIPIYIYGIGVDNNINRKEWKRYKKGLSKARLLCCRDKESALTLGQQISNSVHIYPDVVFALDIEQTDSFRENLLIMPYNFDTAHIHFKSIDTRENYYQNLLEIIENNEYKELILSGTTSADFDECENFSNLLKRLNIPHHISEMRDMQDLLHIYSQTKKLYSGRMHALILALLSGVEMEALEISDKVRCFSKTYLRQKVELSEVRGASKSGLLKLVEQIRSDYGK